MTNELYIAVGALLIAAWQLYLQRREIRLGNQLSRLRYAADLLRHQIDWRERIIADFKAKNDWDAVKAHAAVVNHKLRPALAQLENEAMRLLGPKRPELLVFKQYRDEIAAG